MSWSRSFDFVEYCLRVIECSRLPFWSFICQLVYNCFYVILKFILRVSFLAFLKTIINVKNHTCVKSRSIRTKHRDKRSKQCRFRDHEIFLSFIIDINSDFKSLKDSIFLLSSLSRFWTSRFLSSSVKLYSSHNCFAKVSASKVEILI